MRHSIKNYIVHTDLWHQSNSFVEEREAKRTRREVNPKKGLKKRPD